ncbi:MAG: hypothetical protein HQK83_05855, partial [Fibrobacteria bacterium]|nr:hypothetical protein [Fibrobacteria bacterium]
GPDPADNAQNQETNITLVWEGGDPNEGDEVSYEIYLDTREQPVIKLDSVVGKTTFQISGLLEDTQYFWRILAKDGELVTVGPIWSFKTMAVPRMVAYWDLNEGDGNIIQDKTDGENTGYLRGNWSWNTGVSNMALRFHGYSESDYTEVAVPVSRNLRVKSFTFAAWVYSRDVENGMPLFEMANLFGAERLLGVSLWLNVNKTEKAGGALRLSVPFADTTGSRVLATEDGVLIADSSWHHVAVTFDAETGDAFIYVKGERKAEKQFVAGSAYTSLDTMYIGTHPAIAGSDPRYLDADMDEIKFFNYALNATAIASLFDENKNTPPHMPSQPSPELSAQNQETEITLSWTGGDDDVGDILSYHVYLDKQSPPDDGTLLETSATSLSLLINGGETYYWRVEADDGRDLTKGPIWSFTTRNRLPYVPNNPVPAMNALDIDSTITLQWQGGDPDTGDVVTYDVFLGPVGKKMLNVASDLEVSSFKPDNLRGGLDYQWRVISSDGDTLAKSEVWQFQTKVPRALVMYWRCNEGEGTNIADSSLFNNSGVFPEPYWYGGGISGTFSGDYSIKMAGGYAYTPVSRSLQLKGFTVAFWLYSYGLNENSLFTYTNQADSGGSNQLRQPVTGMSIWSDSGAVILDLDSHGGLATGRLASEQDIIHTGAWYHIAVSYDEKDGNAVIYVNGEQKISKLLKAGTPVTNMDVLYIGNVPGYRITTDHYRLDEIRILNFPLGLEQVQTLYNQGGVSLTVRDE